MAARLIVEPRLAQLVAMNANAADFERMEECNRRAEAAEDFEGFEKWDAALHQAIAEATHNRLIIDIYATITAARDHAEWGDLKRMSITKERRDFYRQEHREIVAALRARDAQAGRGGADAAPQPGEGEFAGRVSLTLEPRAPSCTRGVLWLMCRDIIAARRGHRHGKHSCSGRSGPDGRARRL